ncbi:hypothetical protein D3C71_1965250 [compost metagenome]
MLLRQFAEANRLQQASRGHVIGIGKHVGRVNNINANDLEGGHGVGIALIFCGLPLIQHCLDFVDLDRIQPVIDVLGFLNP